jgi:hypothetical protein
VDPARGGYAPQAVDAAPDRREDVLARRDQDHLISTEGEDAWLHRIGRPLPFSGTASTGPANTFQGPRGEDAEL